MITLADTINKTSSMDVGTGAIYAVVCIIMVFLILLIIIGVTTLAFKALGLFDMKKEIDAYKKGQNNAPEVQSQAAASNGPVEITDDDMMAAVLVATIDYRNEVKKDVRVVSVKEVK